MSTATEPARASGQLGRRAALTIALWAGFQLLRVGAVLALLWIPWVQWDGTGVIWISGVVAIFGAATLAWAVRPRFPARVTSDDGRLDREKFPVLHAFIDEVAAKCGVKPPDTVRLLARASAFAAEDRRWFGLRRTRTVGIGLPLFWFLTREELATVVAHEFGHHAGGDLALGPWVHRTHQGLASVISELDDSAFFLDVPFRAYGRLFLRVSRSVSRAQELDADALAARTFGPGPAVTALRRVHALADAWDAYLDGDLGPLVGLGARVSPFEGFRRFLAAPGLRPALRRQLDDAASAPPTPWDSHPSLTERVTAIDVHARPGGNEWTDAYGGCLELLGGTESAENAFYSLLVNGDPKPADWDDVADRVLVPRMAARFEKTPLDPATTPIERLPSMVREGAALWDRLRPPQLDLLSPEAKRQRLRDLLSDWFVVALSRRGFHAVARPGRELLMRRGDVELVPEEILRGLADGTITDQAFSALEIDPQPASDLAS